MLSAAFGLALMVVGLITHRGGDAMLQGPLERFGLGIELLGLGIVGVVRVLQETKASRSLTSKGRIKSDDIQASDKWSR
jgi:hypothetical protein